MTVLVQTDRIRTNLRILRKQAGRIPLIPLLEANACGLGDAAVAQVLAEEGVRTLAVSRLEEGVRVSEAVRGVDILLMTPYAGEEELGTVLKYDLIAAVGSDDVAVLFSSLSRRMRCRARAQLCFDFGMGRFGYSPQEAAKAAQTIKHLENVELSGVFTVLPEVRRENRKQLAQQARNFQKALAAVEREGIKPPLIHMADFHHLADCREMTTGAVRVSGDLFGRGPQKEKHGLKKVGRPVSTICDMKWLPPGATVGDDGRCRVRKAVRVAVVPAGRADGLFPGGEIGGFRLLKKKPMCEINGKKAAVIGQAGLTALTVDVTGISCSPGDIVTFDADPLYISAFARRDYV